MFFIVGCQTLPKEIRYEVVEFNEKLLPMTVLEDSLFVENPIPNLYRNEGAEQMVEESISSILLTYSAFSKEEKRVFLTYSVDKTKSFYNYDTNIGASFHILSFGILTLLGVPWGNHYYDFSISFSFYDKNKKIIKKYSYTEDIGILHGLYYGHRDFSDDIVQKILNSFYGDIQKEISEINAFLSTDNE